jgi:hypothetical protein
LRLMGTSHLVSAPYFRCSSSTSALSEKYLGFEVSGPAGQRVLWKRFPTPIESSHLIVECECTSVCGPLIPKIQFNGIGGLLTYISLIANADVSA